MASHGSDGGIAAAISVVVPFYNLERYVRPCLDSVVASFRRLPAGSRPAVEVVCVDDGSSDSTGAILDEYAGGLPRQDLAGLDVRVVHQPNGGEGAARNAGVAASGGSWVTFLDGDDIWLANHLEVAAPLLARHPGADIVALRYANFDDGTEPPEPTSAEERVFDVAEAIPSDVLFNVGVFPTFFSRGLLERVGGFSALPLGADRLYVAQCLARAATVVRCDAVVHGYRIRAGSMARAVWNARKVASQCDYAFGSLQALHASGRALGREGQSYLASLWLSDVPNRLARLPRAERRASWERWRATLGSECVRSLPRFDRVRRLLRRSSFSMRLSLALARLLRKTGVS